MRKNLLQHEKIKDNTLKNRFVFGLAFVLATMLLSGCGGGGDEYDDSVPTYVVQILSDPAADGDIAFTAPATYTISSALTEGTILAGIDPAYGDEFRGFLNFPLRGVHGVPSGATIESATLEIFIGSVTTPSAGQTVALLMDLVSFSPPIIASDFDRSALPPLLTMPLDIYLSDAGDAVSFDVTAFMNEAQIEGLYYFQLRFLLDYLAASGLVEIDDSDDATAPLLTVTYY